MNIEYVVGVEDRITSQRYFPMDSVQVIYNYLLKYLEMDEPLWLYRSTMMVPRSRLY